MPLIAMTEGEREAAMQAASSDIRYHLSQMDVPRPIQAALFHKGFTTLRLYSNMEDTKAGMRGAIHDEIGIRAADGGDARKNVALLLAAWDAAHVQVEVEDKAKAESVTGQGPRFIQTTEYAAMRTVLEQRHGTLKDLELPSKSFLAQKLEQVECNEPRAEDLREALSWGDQDVDLFAGTVDTSTGTLKIRPGKTSIALPKNAEELRLVHRRIALCWEMVASKHGNRPWLPQQLLETYRKFSDFVLGKHVGTLMLPGGVEITPQWSLVLSYEAELRKKAYEYIRENTHPDIAAALTAVCKATEVHHMHFLVPLTMQGHRSNRSAGVQESTPKRVNPTPKAQPSAASGAKKVRYNTDDGKRICFKFNAAGCQGNCGFAHVCQRCLGPHSRKSCPGKQGTGGTKRKDTARS